VRKAAILEFDHSNLMQKAAEALREERLEPVEASVEGAVGHGRGIKHVLASPELSFRISRHSGFVVTAERWLAQLACDGKHIGDMIGAPRTGLVKLAGIL
jgi:hypothetical protein